MNTFGSANLQIPLYDPRSIRQNRARFRRDMIPALERANSIYCPTGRWSTRGWILVARSDYDKLDKYSTELQLDIGQDGMLPLKNLSIVQAQCVTRGLASDDNAVYLVELTDDRGILLNEWFQFPLTSQYNIRAPAYPQTFYKDSLNNGVPWTWDDMLQDIWEQMNTLNSGEVLGDWPGLATVQTGFPEGFWFLGVPAWGALNDIIEYLGMTLVCDLTDDSPFTIVTAGAVDSEFSSLSKLLKDVKEDDLEWIDTGAGRVPAEVTVLFRRRNAYYGTEEGVRGDEFQWSTDAVYQVTIPAPAFFTGAVGDHYIWSDFTVEYDIDGVPLPADTAEAATVAAGRVNQYYARVYRQTAGYMTRTYAGALPFTTGSQVDGVCWYQDYRNQRRQGWKTQLVRGAVPPWPNLWD